MFQKRVGLKYARTANSIKKIYSVPCFSLAFFSVSRSLDLGSRFFTDVILDVLNILVKFRYLCIQYHEVVGSGSQYLFRYLAHEPIWIGF